MIDEVAQELRKIWLQYQFKQSPLELALHLEKVPWETLDPVFKSRWIAMAQAAREMIEHRSPQEVDRKLTRAIVNDRLHAAAIELERVGRPEEGAHTAFTCAHCGGRALGSATVTDRDGKSVHVCHADSRDCYEAVTVWGEILGQPTSPLGRRRRPR